MKDMFIIKKVTRLKSHNKCLGKCITAIPKAIKTRLKRRVERGSDGKGRGEVQGM